MTSRLDRHERIAKLRADRTPVPDTEVQELLAELDESRLVSEIEPLLARRTGRSSRLPVQALLLGMCLASARHVGTVTLTVVTDLLFYSLPDATRDQLGLRRYADHAQGFEAAYATVRRRFHRIVSAIDPSPLPKNHRLDKTVADRLQGEADPDRLAHRRSLMLRIINLILAMSLRDAHPLLEGRWNGSAALDATVVGAYAKGLSSDSPVTASDPDAGWYVRTARHTDPQARAAEKQDAKQKDQVKKSLYGYDALLVVARDPDHTGTPLADGSADPNVVPALVVAFSLDKPSKRPAEAAIEALQHVDPRYPRGYLAGDRLYPDQKQDKFQLPVRAMGYQPVYDFAEDQLGVQTQFAGAELIEGNWYCPSMPKPLKDATKDLVAKKIDKQTWIERIRARTAHLFLPKQRPDAEGHRRMMCPAEANRVQCPLKTYTLGRGIHLPLIKPLATPVKPPACCAQRTITIPPEAGAKLWQPLQYGTAEWQRVYFRLRNAIEGMNGFGKGPLYERLESGGTRRIRGIAAQAVLLAFQLAHANKRKLAAWARSVALHGELAQRRSTRRRATKSLGEWTPVGYLTAAT